MKEMDFIDDFIEEYKNNPCLWKADSAHFKNRTKRQEAYMKLIDVAAKHGEHYNIERTKQKINNLRCAFRHQLKKYIELKNKGEKDEPYCPKRRYFESLMFLKDEENPERKPKQKIVASECIKTGNIELELGSDESSLCRGSQKEHITIESVEINPADVEMLGAALTITSTTPNSATGKVSTYVETLPANVAETIELGQTVVVNKEQLDSEIIYYDPNESERGSTHLNSSTPARKVKLRKRSSSMSSQQSLDTDMIHPPPPKTLKVDVTSMDFEKLFTLVCKSIQQQQDQQIEDHYTHLGKIVAHKLRSMDGTQAMYAEKLITDVIYSGQLRQLSAQTISQLAQATFASTSMGAASPMCDGSNSARSK